MSFPVIKMSLPFLTNVTSGLKRSLPVQIMSLPVQIMSLPVQKMSLPVQKMSLPVSQKSLSVLFKSLLSYESTFEVYSGHFRYHK